MTDPVPPTGWIVRRPKPPVAACRPPSADDYPVGTKWECDCGRRFKLVQTDYGNGWRRTAPTVLGMNNPRGRFCGLPR